MKEPNYYAFLLPLPWIVASSLKYFSTNVLRSVRMVDSSDLVEFRELNLLLSCGRDKGLFVDTL
jgi:hypothetical protein